jgi:hypothetical protein
VTAQAQQAQATAQGLAPFTSFAAMRQQRAQAVETLVDSRFDWAHVFHEFGRVLPVGVSIGALEGTVGTAVGATASAPTASSTPASSSSATSSTPASGTPSSPAATVASATPTGSVPAFVLSGCATTQREVAVMLERLRLIDGVTGVSLESSTKSASSGGSSTGNCPSGSPAFTAHIQFSPLPAAPAKKAGSAATVAATSVPATSGASPTTEVSAK